MNMTTKILTTKNNNNKRPEKIDFAAPVKLLPHLTQKGIYFTIQDNLRGGISDYVQLSIDCRDLDITRLICAVQDMERQEHFQLVERVFKQRNKLK